MSLRRARLVAVTLCFALLELGAVAAADAQTTTPPPVSGRRLADADSILPADVLARVALLRGNVELIRRFMGRPQPVAPLLRVEGAQPREVYSQALNLERRSNRLAFEQSRVARNETVPLERDARPADVFSVVDSALEAVLVVRDGLGIEEVVAETPKPESTTPSEVFNEIVVAGAEVNQLLRNQVSPSDVYRLVTQAVHQAAAMQAAEADGAPLPNEPAFEPNKTPRDVYLRMERCFDLVREIAQRDGETTLVFDVTEERASAATPNDVSDLASLLVETLAHLLALDPQVSLPPRAYAPGKRFPAHVYQRTGLLELILVDLASQPGRAGGDAEAGEG